MHRRLFLSVLGLFGMAPAYAATTPMIDGPATPLTPVLTVGKVEIFLEEIDSLENGEAFFIDKLKRALPGLAKLPPERFVFSDSNGFDGPEVPSKQDMTNVLVVMCGLLGPANAAAQMMIANQPLVLIDWQYNDLRPGEHTPFGLRLFYKGTMFDAAYKRQPDGQVVEHAVTGVYIEPVNEIGHGNLGYADLWSEV